MVRAGGSASGFRFAPFGARAGGYGLALLVLASPLALAPFARGWLVVPLILAVAVALLGYAGLAWRRVLDDDERRWLRERIRRRLGR
jgi:hypothetical protein